MAEPTQSILLTVKKMLGIAEEYHAFDLDIIVNINSVFLTLHQLGVGTENPFQITGEEEEWDDFVDLTRVPGVPTYVYLKVRLLFDPPTNSFLVTSMEKQAQELEWRMNVQVDPGVPFVEPDEFVEMTPEEVRVIYEGGELPDVNLSAPVRSTRSSRKVEKDEFVEMTPEEVRVIYEGEDAVDNEPDTPLGRVLNNLRRMKR